MLFYRLKYVRAPKKEGIYFLMLGVTLSGYSVASLSWKSFDTLKIGTIYLLNCPVFTLRLMSELVEMANFLQY